MDDRIDSDYGIDGGLLHARLVPGLKKSYILNAGAIIGFEVF